MSNIASIPRFKLPYYAQVHRYGAIGIETDHDLYYRLRDSMELFACFGYDHAAAKEKLAEEFVWERYIKPGAVKSIDCIQPIIMTFLYKKSARFRAEYGAECRILFGKCLSDKIDLSESCITQQSGIMAAFL